MPDKANIDIYILGERLSKVTSCGWAWWFLHVNIPADMTRKPNNTQDWCLEIVTSCTTSRKALRLIVRIPAIFNPSVRFLNMFENLPVTDFDREIVRDLLD